MKCILLLFFSLCSLLPYAQKAGSDKPTALAVGAARTALYKPVVQGKRLAVFANPTSTIGTTHLVDTLKKMGAIIKVIFGPEHGFRGTADAGEKVGNYTDAATGAPVVSLYGAKRKPSKEDLKDVDLMVFDIQDVGVRFYTYISSLEEYMEAAIENNLPLLLLDRPNPNGHYVDGPVLEKKYRSFIGMQPVPVVYGLTMAEYAQLILKEGWIKGGSADALVLRDEELTAQRLAKAFRLMIVRCGNYDHKTKYELPVKPSPNLPTITSILWYPSTCFFEGTVLSEGRGTDKPFEYFGHPALPNNLFSFTPTSREGAKDPKLKNLKCFGWNVSGTQAVVRQRVNNRIQLSYLIEAYKLFPMKEAFFILPKSGKEDEAFFNKLAGNGELMQQIKKGMSEDEIRRSWEPALTQYKTLRERYLLYADFN